MGEILATREIGPCITNSTSPPKKLYAVVNVKLIAKGRWGMEGKGGLSSKLGKKKQTVKTRLWPWLEPFVWHFKKLF